MSSLSDSENGLLLSLDEVEATRSSRFGVRQCLVPFAVLALCGLIAIASPRSKVLAQVHAEGIISFEDAAVEVPHDVKCEVEAAPNTTQGEFPEDEGSKHQTKCEDEEGLFTTFQMYTDPTYFETAGFRCCKKLTPPTDEEKPPFDPATCHFDSSCETHIGSWPVDEGDKFKDKCSNATHVFIPFMTYTESSHFYCAGFKCCDKSDVANSAHTITPESGLDLEPLPEVDAHVDCTVEDSPDTPMGERPVDHDGSKKRTCESGGGTLIPFEVYTDALNYYTAGFKCCKPDENERAPFDPEDCKYFDSPDTQIGDPPTDEGGKFRASCSSRTSVFIPFEHYTDPYTYYVAGFKCCKKV